MKKLVMAAIAVCAAVAQAVSERTSEDLPEGYTRLEYIQGDGVAAYIQTDYTPTPKTDRIEMEFALTDIAGTQALLWSNYDGLSRRWDFLWFGGNNPKQFRFGYLLANTLFAANPAVNERYTVALEDNQLAWSGGDGVTAEASQGSYDCSRPLALFATPLASEVINFSSMRLYSLKVMRGGELIHEYVPCRRDLDWAVGLYDLAGDAFWGNENTEGEFVAGPAYSPLVIEPVGPQLCTGVAIEPTLVVSNAIDGVLLLPGRDYTVAFFDNVDCGTATAIVTGVGAYDGLSKTVEFTLRATRDWISADYFPMGWIQGDGEGAYIQTDYTPTPKTDQIEMEFALTDLAGTQALLWSNLRGFGKRWDFLWFGGNNPKQFRFGYDSANTLFAASPAANERYTVAMTDNELAWSGGDGVTVGAASSYACSLPLAIFATPLESEVMNFSSMRMYSLVVARKGRQIQDYMQIHDYIPCLRISDFTFGLYDACENRFFGNSGTGLLDGGAGESDVFDVAPIPDQDCTGRKIRPAVEVKDAVTGRILVRDVDYAVYYYGNKDIGTGVVRICGRGEYDGVSAFQTFKIRGSRFFITEDIRPIEFIQGDGVAAYIQTDYTPTPKTDRIEMEFALTDLPGTQALLWSNLYGSGKRWDFLWFGDNNPKQFRFGYDSANTLFAASPAANERYTVTMEDNKLVWSGGDGVTVSAVGQYNCSLPVALFATPLADRVINFSPMRLYSLKVTRSGDVFHEYLPCRRISDGAVGLYDLVENVMLVNANKTGAFTAGPDCPSLPKNGFLISIH